MHSPRLAARYAKSLIDLSVEKGQLEQVFADMQWLQSVCKSNRDVVALLRSPVINADTKKKILEKITAGPVAGFAKAGFSAAQVPDLISSTAYGASANLAGLKSISGLTQDSAIGMMSNITKSANASIGAVNVPSFTPSSSLVQTITSKVSSKSVGALNRISAVDPTFDDTKAKAAMKAVSSGALDALFDWAQAHNVNATDREAMMKKASAGVLDGMKQLNAPWASQITPSAISGDIEIANKSALESRGMDPTTAANLAGSIKSETDSVAGSVTIPQYDASKMQAECTNHGGTWDAALKVCAMSSFSTSYQAPKI